MLADDLPEVFEAFARVSLRRMFGGHGVFREGLMFAVVIHDRLYLKADALTLPAFEARGLPAFEYQRGKRTVRLSYREAPAEVFEQRDEAARWARLAWDAAVRSAKPARPAPGLRPASKRPRPKPGSARG